MLKNFYFVPTFEMGEKDERQTTKGNKYFIDQLKGSWKVS